MTLRDLGLCYLLCGAALALLLALRRGPGPGRLAGLGRPTAGGGPGRRPGPGRLGARLVDAILWPLLWPLYLPVVLAPPPPPPSSDRVRRAHGELLAALETVSDPVLARLLPSREALRRMGEHLLMLDAKVGELDEVLRRPEFSAARAEEELRAAGDDALAREHAALLGESGRRLRGLRERAARERDDLLRLCAQLRLHVTVLRFEGGAAELSADVSELSDVLRRLEGATAAFSEPPPASS